MALTRVEPPGARSCHERHHGVALDFPWQWVDYEATDGGGDMSTDVAEIKRKMTPYGIAMLVAELESRREAAQYGELEDDGVAWDGSRLRRDVGVMDIAPVVLELRLEYHPTFFDGERLVRLYFTEPTDEAILLALSLKAKYPGPIGLDEQNAHAVEAARRGDRWHREAVASTSQT